MSALVDRPRLDWPGTCLLVALCLPFGCKKQEAATSPDERGGELADPIAELARLERRMMELGIAPVPSGSGGGTRDLSETAPTATEPPRETANNAEEEAIGGADVDQAGSTESPPAPAEAGERGASGDSHCRNVCDLSDAICELEVRICGMSSEHAGEPTYAEACERAVDDCEVAGDACDSCSG